MSPPPSPIPLHGGPLHSIEWLLFVLLILGPVLALAATVVVVRRRDALDDPPDLTSPSPHEPLTHESRN